MKKNPSVQDRTNTYGLPEYFRPILWSYDFEYFDPHQYTQTLVVQTINYGTLAHWRWLNHRLGKETVRHTLKSIPASQIRPGVRKLASLLFDVNVTTNSHAQRGAYQ